MELKTETEEKMIKQNQIYVLPSGAIIQVGTRVAQPLDEWNVKFKGPTMMAGSMAAFTSAFLLKFGRAA